MVEPGSVRGGTSAGRNNSASLRRALGIVLWLGGERDGASEVDVRRGAGLAELAEALGENKSTLSRLLTPLCEARLVQQDPDTGRYRLGWRTAALGQAYLEGLDLRGAAREVLQRLVDETGETVHLVVPDLPEVVYVDKVDTPNPVRMYSRIGNRQPAYSTSVGKALLAHSGDEALLSVVENGLPMRTPRTRTTEQALRADLAGIRERGYSVDDIENEPDIRCVGAAVFDHTGQVSAAISVSGPATRVTTDRVAELGRRVRAAADEVSVMLGRRR